MEQIKPVKKSKTDDTQNQAKNISHTSQASKPDGTKKDGIKGKKCNEIDSKNRNKYEYELQETCKDIEKDVHGEIQHTNSRNKTETSRDNFNRTNRRVSNQNNAKA